MRIILFSQAFAVLTVLAVLGMFVVPLAVPTWGAADILLRFIQFEALSAVLAALISYFLPPYIGIMKGENVLILTQDPMQNRTIIKIGKALESKKKGEQISVSSGNSPQEGVVEEYSGLITPARVTIKPESNIKVI